MKIDRLETHDRLLSYQKEHENISHGVQECIRNVPETVSFPFYVYGHGRTVGYDEKVSILQAGAEKTPSNRLIWMPVITKPRPAPNTYLFLCSKNTDLVQIIWILPKRELWEQYAPGKMFHNEVAWDSIQTFLNAKHKLEEKDKDGPTESHQQEWRRIIISEAMKKKREKEMYNLSKQPEIFEKL